MKNTGEGTGNVADSHRKKMVGMFEIAGKKFLLWARCQRIYLLTVARRIVDQYCFLQWRCTELLRENSVEKRMAADECGR